MLRVEIIANHSVEENILDAFSREGVGKFYTKYSNVFGVGGSGPRMGDAVWPEENFSLIVWCEEDEARGIARAVTEVKKQFPDEGIRIFGIPAEANRFSHAAEPVWTAVHPGPAPVRAVPQAPPPGPAYAAPQQAAPANPPPSYAPQQPVYMPQAQPAAPGPAPQAPPPEPAYTAPQAAPPPVNPAQPPYAPQQPPQAPPAAPPLQPSTAAPPASPGPDSAIGNEYDGQNMGD
jgi:hypothetical protein